MKKLFGNKGFTLVEMVVAFAILAVVMLSVTFVISTSSNTYTKIAADINLQYESQLAMSQLQEYIIDCDACIGTGSGGGSLYIINKTDSAYEAYKFAKKTDTDELYFYKATMDAFNPAAPDLSAVTFDSGQLMSSYIKSFTASVSASPDAQTALSVIVTIKYGYGDETYNGYQTFALRNQVPNISSSIPQG
jgi:prepilin-type N-terminal cleavage/methylation domain-containing protein